MTEKRKFLRFPILLKTMLFTLEGQESAEGLTDDFSRKGMSLQVVGKDIKEGSLVQLSLYSDDDKDPATFAGKVVWVQRYPDKTRVGVEISRINPEKKSEILEKAYKIWRKEESKKYSSHKKA